MNKQSCEPISELLVEYADGDLSDADARQVETHLAECPQCRSELRLLCRSLELAQSFWREPASCTFSAERLRTRAARRRMTQAAALATCLVLAAFTGAAWFILSLDQPDLRRVEVVEETPPDELAPPTEGDDANPLDLAAVIAREAQSARLAASAQFLATQTALKEYREQADRYVAEAYGNTIAGRRRAQGNEDL